MSYDPHVASLRPASSPAPWLLLVLTVAAAGGGAWWLNQDRQKARADAGSAALKGTYDKLEEKMKDEIAKGDISLSQDGGKLRVGLVDKILFDSGEAQISK